MRKQIRLFIFVALITSICTGCTGSIDAFNFQEDTKKMVAVKKNYDALMDQGPVRGGSLRLFSTYPDTFNPILTENIYVREMLSNVFESLVMLDSKLNAVPVLAENWSVSNDLLTWTFTLRKNVNWHDNIPFTAEDVEFTLDMLLKRPNESSYKRSLENIAAYMAIDKFTLKVSLKSPNSFLPEAMTFPVMPKHYYINDDFNSSPKNLKPIGTGPYKLVSYTQDKDVKLMISDKWWNLKNSQTQLPNLPYIVELEFKLYEMGKDAVNAFQASEVDVATMSAIDASKYKGRVDLSLKRYPSRNFEYMSYNMNKPALNDKNVRQAIAYAIDRNKLINNLMPGQASISEMPILPNTWINDRPRSFYELNKEKAREILSKGGWKQSGSNFYKNYDGNYSTLSFELLVNQENDIRITSAQNIADQLNEMGFNIQIKKVDFSTYTRLLQNRQFDLAIGGCYTSASPDISFMYASWNNKPKGNLMYNLSGYSNVAVDKLLGNILATRGSIEDGFKLKTYFHDLERLILEDVPYFGLYFYNDTILYNKRIRGELKPFVFNKYYDINKWYLP